MPGGRGRGEGWESRRRIRRRYYKARCEQTLAIWKDEMNSFFDLKQGKEGKSKKQNIYSGFFSFTSVSSNLTAASSFSSSSSFFFRLGQNVNGV